MDQSKGLAVRTFLQSRVQGKAAAGPVPIAPTT